MGGNEERGVENGKRWRERIGKGDGEKMGKRMGK
jgi:hypothetical protein